MASQGWITLHRELLDKPIWCLSTPEQNKIFITLLLMANHEENSWEWKGEVYAVKPGQFITSLQSISEKSGKGISIQNVRTALKRFEKLGFLTNESTKQSRLITIVNWELYQKVIPKLTKELTVSQQRPNKGLTTNNNDNNDKKDNSASVVDIFFEEIWSLYPNKKGKSAIKPATKNKLFKVGKDDLIRAINNYKKEIAANNTESKYIKHGSSFFNGGYEDYLETDTEPEEQSEELELIPFNPKEWE